MSWKESVVIQKPQGGSGLHFHTGCEGKLCRVAGGVVTCWQGHGQEHPSSHLWSKENSSALSRRKNQELYKGYCISLSAKAFLLLLHFNNSHFREEQGRVLPAVTVNNGTSQAPRRVLNHCWLSLAPLSSQAIISLPDRSIFTQVFVAVLPSRGWPIDQALLLGWMC